MLQVLVPPEAAHFSLEVAVSGALCYIDFGALLFHVKCAGEFDCVVVTCSVCYN